MLDYRNYVGNSNIMSDATKSFDILASV